MYSNKAAFDSLRSIASGSLTGSYGNLGTALPHPAVVVTFLNNTNGDVVVSTNGTNDMLYLVANSFRVYDIRTNAQANGDLPVSFSFAEGTQFQVKQGDVVPSSGSFRMECVLSNPQ